MLLACCDYRDYLFRGHSASKTLGMWANVQRGEGLWIFPFQVLKRLSL